MDPFKSDITVTPTVTCRLSSVTKGQPHEIGIFSKSKTTSMTSLSSERPRKLELDCPKLLFGHSSEVQSPIPMQSFNPNEMSKSPSTVKPSILDGTNDTKSISMNKEEPWNIKYSDSKKTCNVTVKDVKKPLNDEKDDFIENFLHDNDDMDTLPDISNIKILFPPKYLIPNKT